MDPLNRSSALRGLKDLPKIPLAKFYTLSSEHTDTEELEEICKWVAEQKPPKLIDVVWRGHKVSIMMSSSCALISCLNEASELAEALRKSIQPLYGRVDILLESRTEELRLRNNLNRIAYSSLVSSLKRQTGS